VRQNLVTREAAPHERSGSVGRWRRYLKHLQPAIDVFEAKGIAI